MFQQSLMEGEYSGLYQVVGVENRFSDGAFTQSLQLLRRRNQRQDFEVNDYGERIGSDADKDRDAFAELEYDGI